MRRVVVTGVGCVSPLGLDAASTWAAVLGGRCGIGPVTLADVADLSVRLAGQVPDFDPAAALGLLPARRLDRFAQLAVVASREARAHARLDADPDRLATVIGSGLGGVATYEGGMRALDDGPRRVSPYLLPGLIGNAAVAAVAQDADARGAAMCPTTACAAGTDAVGLGADMIRLGRADVVLAGGADAPVTRLVLAGFAAMRAASTWAGEPARACRPFARGRDGLVVAEGAAVLVLESAQHAAARGATALAEVAGYAAGNDATHVTSPRPDGAVAMSVIRRALAEAGRAPADVGYVNAHGTATPLNDAVEACVLAEVFGAGGVPVSSTKSMTGHLMGAAGALEALLCVLALRDGMLPPSINAEDVDPACGGLDLVHRAQPAPLRVALSTSFGFGGHDSALVLTRPAEAGGQGPARTAPPRT